MGKYFPKTGETSKRIQKIATYKSKNLLEKISAGTTDRQIMSGYQVKIQDILKGKNTAWRDKAGIGTRLKQQRDIGLTRLEI